ncbi:UNVERIFIED_CONTAM: hypothetical protein Slati_0807800 [Sesamum latifolium]|uniref:Retrotransposon gag domain-containing protein n=1 Tax=Sesamum latifolium TaxID=2727402 RepID=A0AAW2XLS0_9LAMI
MHLERPPGHQYQIGGAPEDERQGVPFTEAVMADKLLVNCRTPAIAEYDGTTDPLEHLSRFDNATLLHRYTDGIKCWVFVTTFSRVAQQWFNQLPTGAIGIFQEFWSLFLHQFASSQKLQKTELSLFVVWQKDHEPLKKYLQRFDAAALEKKESDKSKEAKNVSPEFLPKGGPKNGPEDRVEPGDPPRKGVTRIIAVRPIGGDSCHVRKAEVRKAYVATIKELLDVEVVDAPIIQFGRAEHFGPRNSYNDALVITALLADYEVGCIFIDSRSSADILFGEAYDQTQLGDISLEKVNSSLYGFAGEVVHPRGMISLLLTLKMEPTQKIRVLKFLVVDVSSAYNVILGRFTLNALQAIISLYHMKIKFSTLGGVQKVRGDPLQSRKCYVEAVRKGQKRSLDEVLKESPSCKRGKEDEVEERPEMEKGTPLESSQQKNC